MMNRRGVIFIFLILLGLTAPVHSSFAQKRVGEGYAQPTFGEIVQTMVLLKGYDINDRKVADEYGRLVYCNLYKKNFGNDVAWNKIRSQYVSRIIEKKEYFRVLYETTGIFNLDRYDFETQSFPISAQTAMKNVGSIKLFSAEEPRPDCGNMKALSVFPPIIILQLNQPLTLDRLNLPMEKVEKMLARIEEAGNKQRQVYGRLRMRITDAPGPIMSNDTIVRADLRGDVVSVDFFLDRELTKPIGGVKIRK